MKGISFSLFHQRPISLGDFLIGRMSVRSPTPIGPDGLRTARRGSLAGGGVVLARREYHGSGGRVPVAWRAFLRLGLNSSGGIMRSIKGKEFPISSGFRRWMDNISVRLDWPDGRGELI